jgi:hypothetical protein
MFANGGGKILIPGNGRRYARDGTESVGVLRALGAMPARLIRKVVSLAFRNPADELLPGGHAFLQPHYRRSHAHSSYILSELVCCC